MYPKYHLLPANKTNIQLYHILKTKEINTLKLSAWKSAVRDAAASLVDLPYIQPPHKASSDPTAVINQLTPFNLVFPRPPSPADLQHAPFAIWLFLPLKETSPCQHDLSSA